VGLEHIEAHTTRMLGFVPAETMKSSGVVFEEGDVLYGRMRPYLNKVWLADRDGLCSGEFIVFPKTGALRGAFLKYRLNAQDFVSFTDHSTTGDRPRADFADFGKFPVVVPPLTEQARIADRIDELFTDLDAGVAALKRVKRNLSRYRAAVLHAAVTGRLTEGWRKEHGPPEEPAPKLLERILVERRKQWERRTLAAYEAKGKQPPKNWNTRYKEPEEIALADGSSLPELPEGWAWTSVSSLTSKVVDGVHRKPNYVNSGVPFVTVKNLTAGVGINFAKLNYITQADHEKFIERADPEKGDVLLSKDGTLGVVRVIDTDKVFSIFVSVALLKPVAPLSGDFLGLALMSPLVQAQMVPKGSGLQHIHLEDLRRDPIPVPPLAEQDAILEAASEKLSQIDALEAEVTRGLARAGRLRQAILKAAFEGKLVPQDPGDEPASVLLDRIRQQMADTPKTQRNARKKTTRKAATR
jgi:type I restriction enzyme S subunit